MQLKPLMVPMLKLYPAVAAPNRMRIVEISTFNPKGPKLPPEEKIMYYYAGPPEDMYFYYVGIQILSLR